jgi:hypothetical protein
MGWLHVALVHLNPMGEDDDDFEMNYMLDKSIQVRLELCTHSTYLQISFMIVDEKRTHFCPLERDQFWHIDPSDIELPYTEASVGLMDKPIEYSTDTIR